MTQQNVNFAKIAFSQSVLKIETSGWERKNRQNLCAYFRNNFGVNLRSSGHIMTSLNMEFTDIQYFKCEYL